MINDPSNDSFPTNSGINAHTSRKKDLSSFPKGNRSHMFIQPNLAASPSETYTENRSTSNDRFTAVNETQSTPFAGIPFRNVPSIDYKNMKMMSIRRYNQMLNSPERDSRLKDVSNSYLSP